MKIVHAADLHIDSPMKGLERYEGAPVERVRQATREAFKNVIALCLRERARFLVLAGNVFDGDWKDVNTGLFFVSQLARLREVGCDVLLLRGNHDFELTRALTYPDHVHEFSVAAATVAFRGQRTFAFPSDGIAFHGVSYADRQVKDSLLPHYPAPLAGMLNVGVLHTNATGSLEHAAYAPCTVGDLVSHGYDYWALGHVHGHAVLCEQPFVVYPGNTQGRNVREVGPKGCVLVDVDDDERTISGTQLVETSVMRWFDEELVLERDDDEHALLEAVRVRLGHVVARASSQLSAVRLTIRGGCRAHSVVVAQHERLVAEVRALANTHNGALWLEKVRFGTAPATPIPDLREAQGLVAELLRHTEALRGEERDDDLLRLALPLDPLKKRLRRELEELGLDLSDREFLGRVLDEAEALLAQRLTGLDGATSTEEE
ncbi:MAG: DNA repair exonuclease [Polyangiales bacterium]